MIFLNIKFIKFHGTLWNSMEHFSGKLEVPWNSMEFGSMEKVPWNSMALWIWTKFLGIPWYLRFCCLSSMEFHGTVDVVQMMFKSSTELFDQNKIQWALKRDCEWYFDTYPYPDGVYTPAWSVHSKATLLPLPLECTLQPHSEYHRCTLGCHSMDFVKSLTNRNTLQRHFKCTPDRVYTPLPLL